MKNFFFLIFISTNLFAHAQTTFYGATKITVPNGTASINLKTTTMYRIFARDEVDGDISHKITIDGGNWTATVPSTVTYRITNSKGQETTRQVSISASGNNAVVERTLYTLSRTALQAIQSGGMMRGDNHDRQHLGVFMPAGATLRVRRVSTGATSNWNVKVAQGRSGKDLDLNLSGSGTSSSWQTVSASSGTSERGGIPMIRTPRTEEVSSQGGTVIEVEISGNVTDLNYFHYGDNTMDFLTRWTNASHYALLGNSVANIMVSRADVTNGRFTAGEFSMNINKLLEMYDSVCMLFNRMIGLDINAADPKDKLVHTKYWVVPYRGGAGLAFYGGDYCGYSSGDEFGEAADYLRRSWVVFHEIGHGYEGWIRGKEISMVEIKNNILSTYFQLTFLDFKNDASRRTSWIFEGNNNTPAIVDNRVVNRRHKGLAGFNDGDHFRDKLYFMMTLTNATGTAANAEKALAEINYLNRRHRGWTLADLWTKGLHNTSKINAIPFMESYGFTVSEMTKAQAFEDGSRIAQPFRDLTDANITSHLFPANGRLLWGSLSLVKPSDFDLGNGTATITINIDSLDLIKGRNI
ncbi:MAG: M60 family metallopeptidase, partial [Bacteroidales bacterium]|nr:M60 family metallopeptidase [Bacteroidales bacterium]